MFISSPAVKDSFEQFRTLDNSEELSSSSVMATHGMVVMNAIDEIINNLDEDRGLIDLILDQGKSHARFGDLTHELFWVNIYLYIKLD